ncbi:MAG: hypothetical protein GEU74_00845 [Nitriliruptorales bacterium]|nr:hypothetical protein [Nitriliruptorales bacterium]
MNGESEWRVWWRRAFGTLLLLALLTGLYLSYRPAGFSEEPEVATDEQESDPPQDAQREGEEENVPPTEEDEPPADEGGDDQAMTAAEASEFIEAARDPGETSVQVLDAGGGSAAANAAADALRELGYDVVAINSSRVDYDATTILFTSGNRTEAQALRAREDRVVASEPNERLSDAVDLHLVVAPDWDG